MSRLLRFFVGILAVILVFSLAQPSYAQTRYKDIVFPSATSTVDIQYGSGLGLNGSTAALLLDLYQPTGDTATLRPLVIFLHGGSLVVGDRVSMSTFCNDFARRGYVAATIEYRLGVELPQGTHTILEALLRTVQDTKAAVRFLRSKASEYGIDTSRIYLAGSSAGSMVAVHYAYWDQDEIPPDIDQTKWGDIEGTGGNPGYSSDIHGIINYCGAILDPSWIDADEVPVANFHGLLDAVVPPDGGISSEFGIPLYGGVAVSREAIRLGIYNQGAFFPLGGHGGDEDSLRRFSSNFLYSLMVLSTTPPQNFTSMELSAESLHLFRYDSHLFLTSALDGASNRIILPPSMVQYESDAGVGTIASSGMFTPSDHADSGYVRVTLNSTTDSCFVRTYGFTYFVMNPRVRVTDTVRTITLRIDTYDADSIRHDLAISKFTLTSSDPAVGTIDAMGVFTGKSNGTTNIVASFDGYSDTSVIRVEHAAGLVTFDPLEDLTGWTWEGTNLDSLSVTLTSDQKSAGDAALKIDYSLTYDAAKIPYMVYLAKDMTVYGIPDSMYLDVRSDGRRHRLYYRISDADGVEFRPSGLKFLNDSVAFANINTSMTGLAPLTGSSQATYPLTLKRVELQLAPVTTAGVKTTGTIYLDNLRLKFPGIATGIADAPFSPAAFSLDQNFPNPFNPTTTIQYVLSTRSRVALVVYNILGEKVAELVRGEQSAGLHEVLFDARSLSSGVYWYRLQADGYVRTKNMIVLK